MIRPRNSLSHSIFAAGVKPSGSLRYFLSPIHERNTPAASPAIPGHKCACFSIWTSAPTVNPAPTSNEAARRVCPLALDTGMRAAMNAHRSAQMMQLRGNTRKIMSTIRGSVYTSASAQAMCSRSVSTGVRLQNKRTPVECV